jgi:hypothetical protein
VYDDGNINNGSTRQIFTKRYDLTLPDFLPPPAPPPPSPPLIPRETDLWWNFETFYDNQNAVLFENYSADIVDGKAAIETLNGFLLAQIPSAIISKFSISLIFNFKALNSGDPINFIFSTYSSFSHRRQGTLLRVIDGNIEFELHGKNSPSPDFLTNTLYSIYEPITGFPGVIFDEFCNLAITFDHTTDIIKTYINGVLNSETNALVGGSVDQALGTNLLQNATLD